MGCPKCGSAKYLGKGYLGSGLCRVCYTPEGVHPEAVAKRRGLVQDERRLLTESEQATGDLNCPTCGQRLRPMTGAERQRRYREKRK